MVNRVGNAARRSSTPPAPDEGHASPWTSLIIAHSDALPTASQLSFSMVEPSPCATRPRNGTGTCSPVSASTLRVSPSSARSHLLDSLNAATLQSAAQRRSLRKPTASRSYVVFPPVKEEGASSTTKPRGPP